MVPTATSTPPTEYDNDLDLHEIWPSFVKGYEEILGLPLPERGLDEVAFRAGIDDLQKDLDGSKSKKKTWALGVAKRVNSCLLQFGEIVAQGASVVFGPSEQCWNAISFVIRVAKSYREILEGFVVLLDLCANFLDRIVFYLRQGMAGGGLEHHMRRPAYEFLGHFLQILAHSYNIAHKRKEKLNQLMRVVFFNDDAGVKHEIEELKRLANSFNDRAWDQIYLEVKGITRFMLYSAEERKTFESECRESFEQLEEVTAATYENTKELKRNWDRRDAEKRFRQDIKTIRDAFQLGHDEIWSRTHGMYQARRLGTADWLKNDNSYTTWRDINRSGPTLLTLVGKKGYGKSFVCCNAIDNLFESSRQNNEIHVAYYYFDRSDKENRTLDRCITSIILQLAKSDGDYAGKVAELCVEGRPPGRPEEVWKSLVLNLRQSSRGTDFIIIDDYRESDRGGSGDQSLANIIDISPSQHDRYSIRWLVSSADAEVTSFRGRRAEIRLGPRQLHPDQREANEEYLDDDAPFLNEGDMMTFVESRIADICAKADLGSLLNDPDVKSRLVRGANGDYQLLQGKLNEIDSTSTRNEVKHILSRASETSAASIRRVTKSLDEHLSRREIEQLNELLTWIVFGKGSKTIAFLRSVLLWVKNEDYQLRKQIASKFSTLLDLTEANGGTYVDLAYQRDQVEKVLRTGASHQTESEKLEGSTVVVHQCEIDVIEHFVKTNCTPDLYARFGFENFFKEKSPGLNRSLSISGKNESHAHILGVCLDVLTQKHSEAIFTPVRQHASQWLGEYIHGITSLDEIGEDDLRELGSKLAILLWDPPSVRAWWDEGWLSVLKTDWVQDEKGYCKALVKVLRNDSVSRGFADDSEGHKWLRCVLEKSDPCKDLLAQAAKELVLRAFDFPHIEDQNFFGALGIMSKASIRAGSVTVGEIIADNRRSDWASRT